MRLGGRGHKAGCVAIGFRIPADLDQALRALAKARGVSPGAVIEDLIRRELAAQEGGKA